MAEGKLIVNDNGQLRVAFISTKGKATECAPRQSEISRQLGERPLEQLHNLEVEFDLESGQPRRIRPKGQPFEPPQLAATAPQAATSQAQAAGNQRSPATASKWQQGTTQTQKTQAVQSQILTPAFHNPYNFVPAPPRDTRHSELGDHEPVGHHALFPDRYSGTIRVKMKVVTPLLIPDAAKAQDCGDGHFSFPVRIDSDGRPYIPPTSIKGMLRAAYEAVTNSRLGVFPGTETSGSGKATGHGARLAYRRPARIDVVPARIERCTEQEVTIRILKQLWRKSAARLRRYLFSNKPLSKRKGEEHAALRYCDNSLPQLGEHVTVQVDAAGIVTRIQKLDQGSSHNQYEGWVLITEPNIGSKRFERVFVVSSNDEILTFKDQKARDIMQMWTELIENYQQVHVKDLENRARNGQKPNDYLGHKPGQTAWSRHIWDKQYLHLREGTLCYVRRDGKAITGIYPVTISRELFTVSPLSLLDESLRPATFIQQLSFADRVFGWVNQNGKGSYKGNIRIGPVKCLTAPTEAIENFGMPGLPLAILGQPKPQQVRFYVAASPNGEAQKDGLSKEQAGYAPGKGLRGRKVYPHHTHLPLDYWTNPMEDRTQKSASGYFQEYRRPKKPNGDEQRDDQNRSIQGWIKPNTEFEFDIHVTNLSAVELGALVWLLSLPQAHYHRLGGGKPLGFGSVRLEIDPERTFLYDGKGWKEIYGTLDDIAPSPADCNQLVESFKKAVKSLYASPATKNEVGFEQVPFIAAWLRAAKGHDTGLPTHYPRARQPNQTEPVPPHPEGLAYEWFVANERTGTPGGPKLSLPNLANDKGLPILDRH